MGMLKNEFSWSKSRDVLFQECLRAYFYNHYGSWGGWSTKAPAAIRELYTMKNLNSRAAWLGIIVHEVAERAVRSIRKEQFWPREAALQSAEQRMREELRLSSEGTMRTGTTFPWEGQSRRVLTLQDHYYNVATPPEVWEELIQIGLRCINTLFESPVLKRLHEVGPGAILSVEELQHFDVDGVKVWVKLDLAVRDRQDGIVILDWKTGTQHALDDVSLQLGIYGLYGTNFWEVPPHRILGYDVNLRDGSTRQHIIDEDALLRVRSHINGSASRMKALLRDSTDNIAEIDHFPMTTDLSRCQKCRFRRACSRENVVGSINDSSELSPNGGEH